MHMEIGAMIKLIIAKLVDITATTESLTTVWESMLSASAYDASYSQYSTVEARKRALRGKDLQNYWSDSDLPKRESISMFMANEANDVIKSRVS